MLIMEIKPLVGIGEIRLGMTEKQVEKVLTQEPFVNAKELLNTLSYNGDNQLNFIEISNPFEEPSNIQLLYSGMNLFDTPAQQIIAKINKSTAYINDDESMSGVSYSFKEIGLSFWRPNVITDEIIHSEEFCTQLLPENQEYEKRNLYFTTIAVTTSSYYD